MYFIDMVAQNDDKNYIWSNADIDSRIDKDVLTSEIYGRAFNMRVLYKSIDVFKEQSDMFFKKWKWQISQLIDTMEYDYNPIWNKDGTITENRNVERDREENVKDDSNQNSHTTANGKTVHDESPFNTDNYHTVSRDTDDSNRNDSIDTERTIDTDENESTVEKVVRKEQGNIGLTSTQTLISEQRALMDWNIYNWIIEKYLTEMFIGVW